MSILESLITNRTAADVARWRALRDKGFDAMSADEKAEWLAGMRGAFNAADRNRITKAMVYLKGLYEQYGRQVTYTPVNITHKDGTTDTTWRMDDIPTDEQLTLIVKNLLAFWKGVERALPGRLWRSGQGRGLVMWSWQQAFVRVTTRP